MKKLGILNVNKEIADKSEIRKIEANLAEYTEFEILAYDIIEGAYINQSGDQVPYVGCQCTYVNIDDYEVLDITTTMSQSLAIVAYDKDNTVLQFIKGDVNTKSKNTYRIICPEGTVKVGISNWSDSDPIVIKHYINATYSIKDDISNLKINTSTLNQNVDNVYNKLGDYVWTELQLNQIQGGYYSKSSGVLDTSDAAKTCWYIPLFEVHKKTTKYSIVTRIQYSVGICFYDKDKNFMSAISGSDTTRTVHEFDVPEDCRYIGICSFNEKMENFQRYTLDVSYSIIEKNIDVSDIKKSVMLNDYIDVQPVEGQFIPYHTGAINSYTGIKSVRVNASGNTTWKFSGSISQQLGIAFFNSKLALTNTKPQQFYMSGIDCNALYAQYAGTSYIEKKGDKYILKDIPVQIPVGCEVVSFSVWSESEMKICATYQKYGSMQNLYDTVDKFKSYLYGKTYIAFGDSWTFPRGTASSLSTITYPTYIGNRTGLSVLNYGKSSSTVADRSAYDPKYIEASAEDLCKLHETVSSDISAANFITFAYGINDQNVIKNNGEKTSIELSTTWGAWNNVLSNIYTWNPDVKLGIIINDTVGSVQLNLQKEIAKWWGIPVLDLRNDIQHNVMMENRTDNSVNPFVVQKRAAEFTAESHPNSKCHEFRSTIIEDFLRSL